MSGISGYSVLRVGLNSTMVRFRWGEVQIIDLSEIESQFHYGSIQIRSQFTLSPYSSIVSIPLWFDSDDNIMSIHLKSFFVSIPLWFDSDLSDAQLTELGEARLNSTMVRFR